MSLVNEETSEVCQTTCYKQVILLGKAAGEGMNLLP